MPSSNLTLDAAIAEFFAARADLSPASARGYRTALGALQMTYPGYLLSACERVAGTLLIKDLLDSRWGDKEPETYRRNLSFFRTFFKWHVDAGNLGTNPTDGLSYPPIERKPRRLITREETKKLFEANPDPRDQVPLRLLLTAGLPKGALRRARFGDLSAPQTTVSWTRRGKVHAPEITDDDFWVAVQELRRQRHATDEEYILPAGTTRKFNPTVEQIALMDRDGSLDGGRRYLWKNHEGRWQRTTVRSTEMRDDHGTHNWWYRCAARAGFVSPGATSGFPMMSARYTFGRTRFTRTGSLAEVQQELGGLGRGGSVGMVYRDNADLLNKSIGVVRRRLRLTTNDHIVGAVGIDGKGPVFRWWKEPAGVFAQYVDDERDLIELSRVSVEILRAEDATSEQLREAAETLTRAVTAAELVERAETESLGDHPLLHGHSLVAIWSALETMVGDLLDAWLMWWPASRARAMPLIRTKPSAALPPNEWMAEVRQGLDRAYQKVNQGRSPRRLDRFDWLLDAVGLAADPQDSDPGIRRNLWDMQQIRNVFAHKRGIADALLVKNNRNLPFRAGDQIRIDRNAWSDFLVTTVLYADEITRRMKRELAIPDWQRRIPAPEIRYPT